MSSLTDTPNPLSRFIAGLRKNFPDELRFQLPSFTLDYNGDYRKSVFLAGTARSGTTWVSSILNYDNRYRDMFEPFHSHYVRPHSFRFVYPLYLRPDNKLGNYLRPARRILTGQIQHWWIDHNNRKLLVDRRLIKEIRANLWLKWLKVNFPALPIILLFRHPCAIADSRLTLEWPTRLQQFLAQCDLMEDHLEKYRDIMTTAKTPFERHIVVWCLQYYVPLRQFAPGEIHLAFYENFLAKAEEEIGRLFAFLGQKFDDRIFDILAKPSGTTRPDSAVRGEKRSGLIDSWRKRIDQADVKRALEILSMFGLDRIYCEDPLPDFRAAEAILAQTAIP
jgi:hypothetical protein